MNTSYQLCTVTQAEIEQQLRDKGVFTAELVTIVKKEGAEYPRYEDLLRESVQFTPPQVAELLEGVKACNGDDPTYAFTLVRLPASVIEVEEGDPPAVDGYYLFDEEYPEEGILWVVPEEVVK